jgi:hypothetical protein
MLHLFAVFGTHFAILLGIEPNRGQLNFIEREMKTMAALTEIPPGFAFFASILVYDLILLLRGELTFVSFTPFYEPGILESVLEVAEEYHGTLSQSEVNSGENGFEMDGFATGGETGWDLLLNWDFPDFS